MRGVFSGSWRKMELSKARALCQGEGKSPGDGRAWEGPSLTASSFGATRSAGLRVLGVPEPVCHGGTIRSAELGGRQRGCREPRRSTFQPQETPERETPRVFCLPFA